MKTKLLSVCLLLFSSLFVSTDIFAQRDSGGSSDGGGVDAGGSSRPDECIVQPAPVSFKRNNGQGTCGGDAQIRLSFGARPSVAPILIALYNSDGSPVTNVVLPVEGDMSTLTKKGYISYCLDGGNIKPAKKLTAVFHYTNGCEDTILSE